MLCSFGKQAQFTWRVFHCYPGSLLEKKMAAPLASAILLPQVEKGMLSLAGNRDVLSTFLPLYRPEVAVMMFVVVLLCPG